MYDYEKGDPFPRPSKLAKYLTITRNDRLSFTKMGKPKSMLRYSEIYNLTSSKACINIPKICPCNNNPK